MPRRPVHLRHALVALFATSLLSAPCAVAEPDKSATCEVVVKDLRAPEPKTYRAMLAGLDAFEEE